MRRERICVVVPTFHNEGTVVDVLHRVMNYTDQVYVVVDGEPADTLRLLEAARLPGLRVVSYEKNRGKGDALKRGFAAAIHDGYEYALTLDADGQHFPEDLPHFIEAFRSEPPKSFLIGTRSLPKEKMTRGSIFANWFSNFWFHFQTGLRLADTQCGYRLYPLSMLDAGWIVTSRYEAELEFLVYSAWKGIRLVEVPVSVYYPPLAERVSHFRPFWDFLRITLLNIVLTTGAVFYYLPARIIRCHRQKRAKRRNAARSAQRE